MSKCCFCNFQKLSEWYRQTSDGIVVCKDLHNRQYKYRILVVGVGKMWHREFKRFDQEEVDRFVKLGIDVAKEHIKEGKAKEIADIDKNHMKFPDHFHIQLEMR